MGQNVDEDGGKGLIQFYSGCGGVGVFLYLVVVGNSALVCVGGVLKRELREQSYSGQGRRWGKPAHFFQWKP